jgi:hypothetical protein
MHSSLIDSSSECENSSYYGACVRTENGTSNRLEGTNFRNHLVYLLNRDISTDMIDMIMSIGDVAK